MSSVLEVAELIEKLKNGNIPPNIIVFGEETFFIDKIIEFAENLAQKKTYGFLKYTSNEINIVNLIDLAQQNSLFSSRKILVIKNFGNYLKGRVEDESDEEAGSKSNVKLESQKLLLNYLSNPNPDTVLILTHLDRLDQRTKFFKEAVKYAEVYHSKRLHEKEIFDFIERKFGEKKILINYKEVEYIYKTVGNDLYSLESEIERLFISIEGLNRVDVDTLKKFLIPSRKYTIFDLYNAFRDKDMSQALEIGLNILDSGYDFVYLIVMLNKYFFSLLTFHELVSKYKSNEKVSALIGCHPFFLKDYEIASKRYTFEELQKIFNILLRKDIELKTLNLTSDVLYTSLVTEIGEAIKKM